jgi:hypothetical protein
VHALIKINSISYQVYKQVNLMYSIDLDKLNK